MSAISFLVALFLSVIAGVVPTILYVLIVWWVDRYEKEPIQLLTCALLWGAIPAGILSFILETLSQGPVKQLSQAYSQLVSTSVVAPVVEESIKGVALLGLFWLARHDFDDVLDGIVYGSIVGFGFAMSENILYFLRAWLYGGFSSWTITVLGRALAFGFNHAMFTSFTGVGFGLARYERLRGRKALLILLGLMAAITAHFAHNVWLAVGGFCVLSFLLDWTGVLVVFIIILLAWRRESAWMAAELPGEVAAGVLTPLQFETVSSRRGRLRREWQLLGISGLHQARLWRQLVKASTELAFKKHQQARMGEERGNSKVIAALRGEILRIRRELGEGNLTEARICSACGRPVPADAGMVCPYCQAPWADS